MFTVNVFDQVATIVMRSPPVNALSEAWVADFLRIIDELAERQDWKVLHVRSDQKAFCAGADLKEMRARFDASDGPNRTYAYVATIQRLFARIETLPQVTLAEIGAAALGGGFELALACDLRIAADHLVKIIRRCIDEEMEFTEARCVDKDVDLRVTCEHRGRTAPYRVAVGEVDRLVVDDGTGCLALLNQRSAFRPVDIGADDPCAFTHKLHHRRLADARGATRD